MPRKQEPQKCPKCGREYVRRSKSDFRDTGGKLFWSYIHEDSPIVDDWCAVVIEEGTDDRCPKNGAGA